MQNVIKRECVSLHSSGTQRLEVLADAHAGETPRPGIRLIQAEGRVQAIEFTCACGGVSLVELEYDESPGAAPISE